MEITSKFSLKQSTFHLTNASAVKNHKALKIDIIKNNRTAFIAQMIKMNRKKVEKNYTIIINQLELAVKNKNHKAVEILQEMESQVLETLILQIS